MSGRESISPASFGSSTADWSSEFDLRETVYLNGAYHCPLSRRAIAAVQQAVDTKRDPSQLPDRAHFELPAAVRAAGSQLLGCEPHDLAIASGASHGISLASCGLDGHPGDHVVVPRGEFPANSLPWIALRAQGVELDFVDPDEIEIEAAIKASTRVVAVGHVNYANGRVLDITRIGRACNDRGVLFVVDASQSAGSLPLDVGACGAGVVAIAGYKWLLAPYGTGLSYVHPDWVERLRPASFNWLTIDGADDFNKLRDLEPRPRPGAVRFDLPETAAFFNLSAMQVSLEMLVEIGVERISEHTRGLLDRLLAGLPERVGVESDLRPERRSSILRLVIDDGSGAPDAEATRRAHAACAERGIAVSLRENGLRVSPGIWNSVADIDALLDTVTRIAG